MPSTIFQRIFDQAIDEFDELYELSRDLYRDELARNKLFHAGQFGAAREKAVCRLLRVATPTRFGISSGFIINSSNEHTTECDVIVYDKTMVPFAQTQDYFRFFLDEGIMAIGEVKSVLTKTKLHSALIKLAQNKKIRDCCNGQSRLNTFSGNHEKIETWRTPLHSPFTFLLCESIEGFSIDLVEEVDKMYDSEGIAPQHRHNYVVSLNEGAIAYNFGSIEKPKIWYFPLGANGKRISPLYITDERKRTLFFFLSMYSNALQLMPSFYAEPMFYLSEDLHQPMKSGFDKKSGTGSA